MVRGSALWRAVFREDGLGERWRSFGVEVLVNLIVSGSEGGFVCEVGRSE